jgi:hypothetical protein
MFLNQIGYTANIGYVNKWWLRFVCFVFFLNKKKRLEHG